jgi:hypothetical protein
MERAGAPKTIYTAFTINFLKKIETSSGQRNLLKFK